MQPESTNRQRSEPQDPHFEIDSAAQVEQKREREENRQPRERALGWAANPSRSMSGSTEPRQPASVTATRFSGAITLAASVSVASVPATTVPTRMWVGNLAMMCALRRLARRRRGERRLLLPTRSDSRLARERASRRECGKAAFRARASHPALADTGPHEPPPHQPGADARNRSFRSRHDRHQVVAAGSIGVALVVMASSTSPIG